MTLAGFSARNHPQQVGKRGPNPSVDDRGTDPALFMELNARFGGFTIDVAAAPHNAKCARFYTVEDDGLAQSWAFERVWCNPPYSDIASWVEKAWREINAPDERDADIIVMLLPANRTEQQWWQRLVEPHRDRDGGLLRVEFLPGRPRFIAPGDPWRLPNQRPPFGCCLLIWSASR